MSSSEAGRPRSIRLWPALVILALAALALAWIFGTGDATGQERTIRAMPVLFFTVLLLLLWLAFLSRLRWKIRGIVLLAVLVAAIGFASLVKIRGVTGDLVPVLGWRWSSDEDLPRGGDLAAGVRSPGLLESGRFDYPQFLGPSRNGNVTGYRLDRDWTSNPPRELWRREIGAGWSGFAISGRIAVTQEQRGPEEWVSAYDVETGELLWRHADRARYETTIGGIGPRATPTIGDGRVWAMGATGILNALDLASGEPIWQRDVLDDHGASNPDWGKSCSPLLVGDLVVVSAGGTDGRSLAAYDRENGEPVWHGGSARSGYSSPLLTTLAGVPQIVIFNKSNVAAHDPGSGELLWEFPWSSDQPNVAQPLPLRRDRLLVSSGYGIGSKLLRIGVGSDGELRPELLWESPRLKAKFANSVFHDGYVYGLDDGVLVCLDPETGERVWKRGRHGHGQVILVEDLLLVQTERGEVVLVEPTPDGYSELGSFPALDTKSWNSPALAGPYLLVRNDREAACFELPLDAGAAADSRSSGPG